MIRLIDDDNENDDNSKWMINRIKDEREVNVLLHEMVCQE